MSLHNSGDNTENIINTKSTILVYNILYNRSCISYRFFFLKTGSSYCQEYKTKVLTTSRKKFSIFRKRYKIFLFTVNIYRCTSLKIFNNDMLILDLLNSSKINVIIKNYRLYRASYIQGAFYVQLVEDFVILSSYISYYSYPRIR